jgi:hypothetical protein
MMLILFGLPLVAFVSLAMLPPGRPAAIGVAVAAAAVALVVRSMGGEGAAAVGWLWGGAVALAGLAQGLRWAAVALGRPVPYGLIIALCVAGVMVPALVLTRMV